MIAEREKTPIHERTAQWVEQMRKLSSRQPRRYESILDAFTRMQDENPHLSPEHARHLTVHGVSQNEDGTYSWKFDNYVRAPFHRPVSRQRNPSTSGPALPVRHC